MRMSTTTFLRQLEIKIFSRLSFKFSFSWSEKTETKLTMLNENENLIAT